MKRILPAPLPQPVPLPVPLPVLLPVLLLALLHALCPRAGVAHEVRPALARISQAGSEQFDTIWRVPARFDQRLAIDLVMPDNCTVVGEPLTWRDADAAIRRASYFCAGGLAGRVVRIAGLEASLTDALLRFERADGTSQIARLTPAEPMATLSGSRSRTSVAGTYVVLGVEHILLGIDHLLFVLALLLLVPGTRTLVWTITSFTLAHSVTLFAATLGWVRVPQAPVEAVIALSILFVAMEIVHWRQGRPGITRRWPWLVAFTFGLLHGFGFAGALSEIGLPENAIPLALLFFNLGVEGGQLLFIAAVMLLWLCIRHVRWPQWAWRVPVYLIGSMAAFWTIQRVAGFVP